MKKLLIFLSIIIGTIMLLLIGVSIYYYSQKITYNKIISAPVRSKVQITRDIYGIPLIKADSLKDVYYALGYIHAADRIKLLQYYRAIADSKMGEIAGKEGETLDRIIDVSGIRRAAEKISEKLEKPYRDYLTSYVDGINYAKKENPHGRNEKTRWNITDIISILLLREWADAFLNNKENIFQFPVQWKGRLIKKIIPDELIYYYEKKDLNNIQLINKIKGTLNKFLGLYNKGFSIYISPLNTKKGKSLTGFSYDSSLNIYPCYYPVHIVYKNFKIKGITLSGLPFIFSGDNGSITFFGFSLNLDTQDFLEEEVKTENNISWHKTAKGWIKIASTEITETGKDSSKNKKTMRAAENGPILNYISEDKKHTGPVIVLKTMLPDENYIRSLFDIPFSDSIMAAEEKVKNINSFPRIYMFSSEEKSVNIYSGKFPLRSHTKNIFKPAARFGWKGLLDLSNFSYTTKSNNIAGSSFFYNSPQIIRKNYLPDNLRSNRLKKFLEENIDFNEKKLISLLEDNYSIHAENFKPVFLTILASNPITSARLTRIYFNQWNQKMDAGKVAPSLFNMILKNFIFETYLDEVGNGSGSKYIKQIIKDNYTLLLEKFYELVKRGDSPIFDNKNSENTETLEITFDRAFIKSMRALNRKYGPIMDKWKWGTIHKGHYEIPLSETSLLNQFIYKIKDTPFNGGISTVKNGKTDKDMRPALVTSLSGIYHRDSKIFMNFSYSTTPLSEFYYGKSVINKFVNFEKIKLKYNTVINPSVK